MLPRIVIHARQTVVFDAAARLADVCRHCSYLEPQLERPADAATFARVAALFDHKAVRACAARHCTHAASLQKVLLCHVASIVVTPWMLLVRLPVHSRAIVAFFANGTLTNPVIGDIYSRADYRAAAEHGEVSRAMCDRSILLHFLTGPQLRPRQPGDVTGGIACRQSVAAGRAREGQQPQDRGVAAPLPRLCSMR